MNLLKRPEFFFTLLLAFTSPIWAAPTPIDHVVAVVNDEVITRLELSRHTLQKPQVSNDLLAADDSNCPLDDTRANM